MPVKCCRLYLSALYCNESNRALSEAEVEVIFVIIAISDLQYIQFLSTASSSTIYNFRCTFIQQS